MWAWFIKLRYDLSGEHGGSKGYRSRGRELSGEIMKGGWKGRLALRGVLRVGWLRWRIEGGFSGASLLACFLEVSIGRGVLRRGGGAVLCVGELLSRGWEY